MISLHSTCASWHSEVELPGAATGAIGTVNDDSHTTGSSELEEATAAQTVRADGQRPPESAEQASTAPSWVASLMRRVWSRPASAEQATAAVAASPQGAVVGEQSCSSATPRRWLSRNRLQTYESLTGSFALHGAVLAALALLTVARPERKDPPRVLRAFDRPQEELTQRLDESTLPAESLSLVPTTALAIGGSSSSMTPGAGPTLDQTVVESVGAGGPVGQVSLADVSLKAMPSEKLAEGLGMESPGEPSAVVDGYSGAMDQTTQEILLMLAQGKVLVVWLFDESESMKEDRQEIRDRVKRIYEELGLSAASKDEALFTAVASYGDEVTIHTRRPTDDLDVIRAAIEEVPIDESGTENMCKAIVDTIAKHRRYGAQGGRHLALIVVTDESGDDGDEIEFAIAAAREANCRIYVMGRESPFGYPYLYRTWTHEDTGLTFWLQVNRGPETPFVELLQTNGLRSRHDAHSSGFGPYEQMRLCRETGGIFYMLPSVEPNVVGADNRKYELQAMRPYLPDLTSRQEYEIERDASPLRRMIWEVVATLNPWQHSELNLEERFPLKMEELATAIAAQQKKVVLHFPVYDAAEKRLEELKRERQQEPSPRWQANYDLLYAQVLCYKVRVYEYAAYLDAFLKNPKAIKKPDTTFWLTTTRARTITGETTAAYVERAKAMFEAIVANHPGTPYANRANWELGRGFGIELVEDNYDERHYTIGPTIKTPKL